MFLLRYEKGEKSAKCACWNMKMTLE